MSSFASAQKAFAIVPADATILATRPRALYIGVTGDVSVIMAHDDPDDLGLDFVIFKNVPAGTTLDIKVKRVKSTGTSATNILGLL